MKTWEEIKTWKKKENGWMIEPESGKEYCYIGARSEIGAGSEIGAWSKIGERSKIGAFVSIPIYKSAGYSMHWHSIGHIRSGCIVKPFAWWKENILRCAEEHNYTEHQQRLYQFFVDQIIAWEEAMGNLLGTV